MPVAGADWDADQNIELGAFGSGVVEIQKQSGTDFLLNIQIADLHVSHAIVGIDGIVVGDHPAAGVGKPFCKVSAPTDGLHVGCGSGEGRLKSKLLRDGLIGAGVVVDAVAGANHCFVEAASRRCRRAAQSCCGRDAPA